MSGFPETGAYTEIGHAQQGLAGPVSLFSYVFQQQGPGPLNLKRLIQRLPAKRKTWLTLTCQAPVRRVSQKERIATGRPEPVWAVWHLLHSLSGECRGGACYEFVETSVLLFTSLLAIPLARQSCLYAFLLTGLQVVGVTLDLLDDVLLLYLPLEPAQRIFERLAFLYANLCQKDSTSKPAKGLLTMIPAILELRSSQIPFFSTKSFRFN
jgi:hypothetical protein